MKGTQDATLLLYGETTTWWARLPESEIPMELSRGALHYGAVRAWRVMWSCLFGVGVPLIPLVLLIQYNGGLAVVLWVVLVPLGGCLGWMLGAKNEAAELLASRIWMTRTSYNKVTGERTIEPMAYEPLLVEISPTELAVLLNKKEQSKGQSDEPDTRKRDKKMTTPAERRIRFSPGWTSKSFYDMWGMDDERAALKGGASGLEKLKIGALCVTAVALVFMVLLVTLSVPVKAGPAGGAVATVSEPEPGVTGKGE